MSRYTRTLFLLFALTLSITTIHAQEEALFKPYGGGSGRCYGRALLPPQFDTIEEKLVIQPAYSYLKEIQPVFKETTERVLVEPEHVRYEIVPAQFETTTEQVKIKAAETYVKSEPELSAENVFVTETEFIETVPASKRWEKTKKKKNCKSKDPEDCLEWQLVDVPPVYERVNVKRKIQSVVDNSLNRVINNAAEYQTITKKTLVRPAEYREIKVPAKYMTITKYEMVEERRFEQVSIPAEYKTVKKLIPIRAEGVMEAREVICVEQYDDYIVRIQLALEKLGYDVGELDGVLGAKTKKAIMKFQTTNDLPIGQLDFLTMRELGLIK